MLEQPLVFKESGDDGKDEENKCADDEDKPEDGDNDEATGDENRAPPAKKRNREEDDGSEGENTRVQSLTLTARGLTLDVRI